MRGLVLGRLILFRRNMPMVSNIRRKKPNKTKKSQGKKETSQMRQTCEEKDPNKHPQDET